MRNYWKQLTSAATSGGLQPFKVVVVGEGELKSQLAPHTYGQSQVKDAPYVLVFSVETDISEHTVDAYVERAAEVRGQGKESIDWLFRLNENVYLLHGH